MGTRNAGAETVYAAADAWVERALRSDDSLFTPGRRIWASEWIDELRRRFLDSPDESQGSFFEKLERQLVGASPEAYQLMAEVLYVYFLIVYTTDSSKEQAQVESVLAWSPEPVAIPPELVAALAPGLVNPGPAYHTYRPFQVGLILEFAGQWKQLQPDERRRRLDDPWAFKDFLMQLRSQSALLRNDENKVRVQRQVLLHLVHPDTFESIVSVDHKNKIAVAFDRLIDDPTQDVDRNLRQIRSGLEARYGTETIEFYRQDMREQWDEKYRLKLQDASAKRAPEYVETGPLDHRVNDGEGDAWDTFVKRAQEYVDAGQLDIEENDYKLEIGRRVAEAREAALAQASNWASLSKSSIASNLLFHVQLARFGEWVDDAPDQALAALQAIWVDSDAPASERVQAFADLLPRSVVSGAGIRTTIASVLLMGVDVRQHPPFRVTLFAEAYRRTGYEQPSQGAGEAELYDHALGFLDRLIDEASARGLNLRHRLDAQSVVSAVIREDGEPPDPTSLAELAEELSLPVAFLEEIELLLKDKRQVIFQGPPGTGKTYVAQELAQRLAGADRRVTLVQFHPSYAYEDFVQGYRPDLSDAGQPIFKLKPGPLLLAAEAARGESEAKHFLVIDEINRGNLAKVFGELYFLLEYRERKMRLQYSDTPLSLPDNLYIIGTMNTADRSIALVDLALRRRFHFVDFHPDDPPIKGLLRRWLAKNGAEDMAWVADVVDRANEQLSDDRHAAIGPSHLMKPNLDEADVKRIWKHSVVPYVEERLFGSDDRVAAFDLDALRAKTTTASESAASDEPADEPANSESSVAE